MYAYPVDANPPLRHRRPESRWKALARRVAIAGAVFVFTMFAMAKAVHGEQPAGYRLVTVQPGDTVWAIAAERYPRSDTRQKVEEILQANGLSDAVLRPGQELKVPAG
jgi:Tfp pilus assembly protein FimV